MTIVTPTAAPRSTNSATQRAELRFGARTANWEVLTSARHDEALSLWRWVEDRFRKSHREQVSIPLAVSSRWTEAWLQHYGDCVPHEYLVLRDAFGPSGIALVTRGARRGLIPFCEQTRHLGTAGELQGESVCVEHNQLLVLPEQRVLFHEVLISHVLQDKSWESFRLDGFTEEEARTLMQELPGFEIRFRESPYYDLRATRESGGELLDRLGRSTRQNTRRLLRKYDSLDVEWADNAAAALAIFSELQELHQARWRQAGEAGAFHSARFRGFQRRLVEQTFEVDAARRDVVLFRVRTGQQTVGCLMLLVDGNRLLDYLSGFAPFDAVPSPGVVTHVLCMQEALRRGYDAYDFLVGEKRHKANLSTDVGRLVWATWSRPSLRSRTIRTLRTLKRRWKEFRRADAAPSLPDPAA